MSLRERTEDAGGARWQPDPLERNPGALCVSARGDVVRTWGLGTIDRPELVLRGCPGELGEVAKALLWDLAGWVVATNQRLELWPHDPAQGGFAPGLAEVLPGRW